MSFLYSPILPAAAQLLGATTAGYVKVWDGATWQLKPVKVWTGSQWVIKPMKFWDGASWTIA